MNKIKVYSIGNILMDVLAEANDNEIKSLGLDKGIMKLVDLEERTKILDFIIEDRDRVFQCGGSAPNTAITLAALGVPTALSGKVGRDELGHAYIRQLE
jgi:sugar/nucleoside kinase (ribokinase family)